MTRLNKSIKQKIAHNALVKSGVFNRQDSLDEKRSNFAEELRVKAIGGKDVDDKLKSSLKKIKAYLAKNEVEGIRVRIDEVENDDELYCNFAGMSINLNFSGKKSRSGEYVYKYIGKNSYRNRLAIKTTDKEYKEFSAIESEQKTIDDIKETVSSQTWAVLDSVTTIKKLVEIWPEVREILPEEEKQASTVIVANVGNLNAAIGLPTSQQ